MPAMRRTFRDWVYPWWYWRRHANRLDRLDPNRSIRQLFAKKEQGIWLDPSDRSTLYQDAAGTTPVTADGQPVGLVLDKRLWGGRTLQQMLAGQPELVRNGNPFVAGSWSLPAGWSVSGGVLACDGSQAGVTTAYQADVFNVGDCVKFTIAVQSVTRGTVRILAWGGVWSSPIYSSPGTYTFIQKTTGATTGNLALQASSDFIGSIRLVSAKVIPGNHASQTVLASRPTFKTNGVLSWLAFDGVDDGLVTSSVDLSSGDEITAIAGLQKLTDAATNSLVEFSASSVANNGTFALWPAYSGAGIPNAGFHSRGTATGGAVKNPLAAPVTLVATGLGKISADVAKHRNNGAEVTNGSDQGIGNYGNYPIYIGRRGGVDLPFKGNLYGLILRAGLTADPMLSNAERAMAAKTGVSW